MTKMTVLHFASPFAFSMPVAPKEPAPIKPAALPEQDGLQEAATALSATGSSDPKHDGVTAFHTVQASDGDQLGVSVLDTVLQRYRAHEGGTFDAAPRDAAEDQLSSSG